MRDDQWTLTESFVNFRNAERQRKAHEHRLAFEAKHGPTDANRAYTTYLPTEVQDEMLRTEPQKWFNGLPGFLVDFFNEIMNERARTGQLDKAPQGFLKVYVANSGSLTPQGHS